MFDSKLQYLLDKYINGQCTKEEAQIVEDWYEKLKNEKNYLSTLSAFDNQLLKEQTFQHILSNINTLHQQTIPFWKKKAFNLSIAASVLLFFCGWLYFSNFGSNYLNSTLTTLSPSTTIVRIGNSSSQLTQKKLPDGTIVWLYPNAEISYHNNIFGGKNRPVTFIGEGFFEVAHDKSRPFIIQSGKMQIKVLGTKFNVKASPNQSIFQVAVVSGSVAVKSDKNDSDNGIVLTKNQKVLFEVATQKLTTIDDAPTSKKEIFEAVNINFDETPISDVVAQLQKKFNIRIQLSDKSMANCSITADFTDQSLPLILETICTTLEYSYTLSDNVLILKGAGCTEN